MFLTDITKRSVKQLWNSYNVRCKFVVRCELVARCVLGRYADKTDCETRLTAMGAVISFHFVLAYYFELSMANQVRSPGEEVIDSSERT